MKSETQFFSNLVGSLVEKKFGIETHQSHRNGLLAQLVARSLDMGEVASSSLAQTTILQKFHTLTVFSFQISDLVAHDEEVMTDFQKGRRKCFLL